MKKLFSAVLLILLFVNISFAQQQTEKSGNAPATNEVVRDENSALAYLPASEIVVLIDVFQISSSPLYPAIKEAERQIKEQALMNNPELETRMQNFINDMVKHLTVTDTSEFALGVGHYPRDIFLIGKGSYNREQLLASFETVSDIIKLERSEYDGITIYQVSENQAHNGKKSKDARCDHYYGPQISFAFINTDTLIVSSNEGVKSVLDVRANRKPGAMTVKQMSDYFARTGGSDAIRFAMIDHHLSPVQEQKRIDEINKSNALTAPDAEPQSGEIVAPDANELAGETAPSNDAEKFQGFYGSIDMSAGFKLSMHGIFQEASTAKRIADDIRNSVAGTKTVLTMQAQQDANFAKMLEAIDHIVVTSANEELSVDIDFNTQLGIELIRVLQANMH